MRTETTKDKIYKIPFSVNVKFTSLLITALSLICFYFLRLEKEIPTWISTIFGCIIIFTFAFTYAYMPRYIQLNNHSLIVKRGLGKLTIPYSQIIDIRQYKMMSSDIRLFGSGGFLGWIGLFYNKKIGRYYAYVGNLDETFLVITRKGRWYLLSAHPMKEAIKVIKKRISIH